MRFRRLLLSIITFLNFFLIASAQELAKSLALTDSLELSDYARMQILIAEKLEGPDDSEEAKSILKTALQKVVSFFGEQDTLTATLHREIGWVYFNQADFKTAETYFKKALQIRKNFYGVFHAQVADSYRDLAEIHYTLGNTAETAAYDTLVLNIRKKILSPDDPALAQSYFDVANSAAGFMNLREALQSAKKGLEVYLRAYGKNHMQTAHSYMQTGNFYARLGMYDQAIAYNLQALGVRRMIKGDVHHMVGRSYYEIGGIYEDKGDLRQALEYYEKSLQIFEQTLSPFNVERGRANRHVGSMYTELGSYQKARKFLLQGYEIAKKTGEQSSYLANAEYSLGRWEELQGNYEAAISHYQAAFHAWKSKSNSYFAGSRKIQIAGIQMKLGQLRAAKSNLDSAAWYLGLDSLGAIDYQSMRSPEAYQKLLANYARYYFTEYQVSGEENTLDKALQYDERNIDLFNFIYEQKKTGFNRSFAAANFSNILETIVERHYQAYRDKGQDVYLKRAFEIIERQKSAILLDYLVSQEAIQDSGIPENVLMQERKARTSVDSLEKILYKAEQEQVSIAKIDQLYKKVFAANEAYFKLTAKIERGYPEYGKIKYARKNNSYEDVRAGLSNQDAALIEYYLGADHVYAFIIDDERFHVQRMEKPTKLVAAIDQLRKNTYSYYLTASRTDSLFRTCVNNMVDASYELYLSLFAPVSSNFDLTKKLIIIPDAILCYLPFELLISEKPKDNFLFGDHRYLLKDYEISYAYSASLLLEMRQRTHQIRRNNLLAFAPTFKSKALYADAGKTVEEVRSGMGALVYNIPEVEALERIIGGEIFTGEKATRENFYHAAPDYKIIHLATHGKANDRVGDYAYLAFSETSDSLKNGLLYNRDLYNLQLNADMVVLSACETGIGELQRGEGVISLTRGFSYAGAKSIITTLWSVDDQKTKEIMESFYGYVKKGLDKSTALRKAKLDFIEQYSHDAHPFYWSGFIAVGDMSPIKLADKTRLLWVGLSVLLLLSLIIYFKRLYRP